MLNENASKKSVRNLSWIACAGIVISITGCQGFFKDQAIEAVQDKLEAKLDSSITAEERKLLLEDAKALANYEVKPPANSWFEAIFGGTSMVDVGKYFDARVKHIYSHKAKIEMRVPAPQGPMMTALNLSVPLWFETITRGGPVVIKFNDLAIPVNDSHVGVIQLGQAYSDRNLIPNTKEQPFTPVSRTSILIHEARHSDCRDGIGPDELARLMQHKLPLSRTCGYMHKVCEAKITLPDGTAVDNPYAGAAACDDIAWGAYSVQAVYAMSLAKNCTNCSEHEKQEALMVGSDALMRLSGFFKDMLAGKMGKPDMNSKGLVR